MCIIIALLFNPYTRAKVFRKQTTGKVKITAAFVVINCVFCYIFRFQLSFRVLIVYALMVHGSIMQLRESTR